jgi:hypothetical protein
VIKVNPKLAQIAFSFAGITQRIGHGSPIFFSLQFDGWLFFSQATSRYSLSAFGSLYFGLLFLPPRLLVWSSFRPEEFEEKLSLSVKKTRWPLPLRESRIASTKRWPGVPCAVKKSSCKHNQKNHPCYRVELCNQPIFKLNHLPL